MALAGDLQKLLQRERRYQEVDFSWRANSASSRGRLLRPAIFWIGNSTADPITIRAMSLDSAQVDGDRLQVQKCQQGDPNALAWLREKCHSTLTHILLSRGANPTEAEDTLAD